ncbi:MAG TPA: hypothetical protein VMT80_00635 [Candidatus Paceibacterota bacterium]|nr:hypothetical protein [Candidatus Paceibacterota bacterium]
MKPAPALALLAILALAPLPSNAQTVGSTAPFTLSMSPQYATPGGSVTLTPLSSTMNLANATLAIFVNGKQVYSGNVAPTQVTVGPAGAVTTIKASVTSGGAAYSQTLSIIPQDVSLIIEPIASAPALYAGKPPVPLEGAVRLIAVASFETGTGKATDPSALSYSWTVDGAKDPSLSGIGKNAVTVASPLQYRRRTVSVAIENADRSLAGGASLSFSAQNPSVRLYEDDPLLGIRFDSALAGSYHMPASEAALFAAPFGFPISTGAPSMEWFLNGAAAQAGPVITLRPTGSGQGSASLTFSAKGGLYTTAAQALTVTYGASSNSGLFGL